MAVTCLTRETLANTSRLVGTFRFYIDLRMEQHDAAAQIQIQVAMCRPHPPNMHLNPRTKQATNFKSNMALEILAITKLRSSALGTRDSQALFKD